MTEERGNKRGKRKNVIQSVLVSRLLLRAPRAQSPRELVGDSENMPQDCPAKGKEVGYLSTNIHPSQTGHSLLSTPTCYYSYR